jgi:cytochrome c556
MRVVYALAVASAGLITAATLRAGEKPPEAHVKLMKETNTAAQGLRGHLQAKEYDAIAADAATLKKLFADVEAFWTTRKADDAIGFARAGTQAAGDLESAAKATNQEGVEAAAKALNGTCTGCHAAHRERLPDGSSEIK